MRAFRFRLDRVLRYRGDQLKTEEAALERLWAIRRQLEAGIDAIDASIRKAQAVMEQSQFVLAADLFALELFHKRMDRERQDAMARLRTHEEKIERQKQAVIQARSKVKLLEKLRENRREEWRHEFNKELEELTADFTAAQWLRLQAPDTAVGDGFELEPGR